MVIIDDKLLLYQYITTPDLEITLSPVHPEHRHVAGDGADLSGCVGEPIAALGSLVDVL